MSSYPVGGLEDETTKKEVMKVDHIDSEAMPAEIVESETVESKTVDAEIVDEVEDGNDAKEAAFPSHRSSGLLTAKTLFRQALKVSAGDPARQWFGFNYEQQLQLECEAMLDFPIEKNDLAGLEYAMEIRRYNHSFFQCVAIDTVLYNYRNACFMKETKQ